MAQARDERGFALPLTILVVTVMTMLIAAAHVRVRADRLIAESSGATVDAFAVAQSGLNRYFSHYDTLTPRTPPPNGDSLRINVPHGYADVRAYQVQTSSDSTIPDLYIVRSTGHLIEPTRGSDPQAQRTVAQFAHWQWAAMTVTGAFTAANGLSANPTGTVQVRGFDQCASPAPAVAGVRLTSGSTAGAGNFDVLTGSPAFDLGGGGLTVANETMIDWSAVVGGQFNAEYDSFSAWDPTYPSILINGDLTVADGGGYGLLMVTGDLVVNGFFFSWRGAVLVGGRLVTNTQYTTIRGVIVTGLNVLLGMSPAMGQVGGPANVNQDYLYHACEVRQALDGLIGFVPVGNAWMDNWAMY